MSRSTYLEFVVRLAVATFPEAAASEAANQFIRKFLFPIYKHGKLVQDRKIIRGSTKLNELLHENQGDLKRLYAKWCDPFQGFTLDRATAML